MATYGYARVSTREQNLDRQMDALLGFGLTERQILADKASGKDFDRPQWRRLMRRLRSGDLLVVKSIDRLGRDYNEIIEQWRHITKDLQADVVVLDMPLLDTRQGPGGLTGTLIADIVLQILSYVAQIEREGIRQRQSEGIAAAKARGVRFGRPRKEVPACFPMVRDAYRAGEVTRRQASETVRVTLFPLFPTKSKFEATPRRACAPSRACLRT